MDTCEVALLFRSANIGQYTISQVYKPDKGRELISYNIRWKDVFTDFICFYLPRSISKQVKLAWESQVKKHSLYNLFQATMHACGYTLQLLASDVTSRKKQNIHNSGIQMPASHQMFISVSVNK